VFERFTDRARRVVVLAQEEARLLDHNYIGTEHVLLGLLHEGEGIAAQALSTAGVDSATARVQVEEIVGRGAQTPSGHIPFTPGAKKLLEHSLREALQLGHNYIGTEHILLGLLREGEGAGVQVLTNLGVDLADVRQQVIVLLSVGAAGAPTVARGVLSPGGGGTTWEGPGWRATYRPPAPATACAFCGRDLYEVERTVTNGHGVLLCKDCAWLAVQTMERAAGEPASVRPLRLPPRVFGDPTDQDAVDEIVALFDHWGDLTKVEGGAGLGAVHDALSQRWRGRADATFQVDRIRFLSPSEAAVRFSISPLPQQTFDGRAVHTADGWKIARETYCMVAALGGVPCPPEQGTEASP
jgi:hypothetical protein